MDHTSVSSQEQSLSLLLLHYDREVFIVVLLNNYSFPTQIRITQDQINILGCLVIITHRTILVLQTEFCPEKFDSPSPLTPQTSRSRIPSHPLTTINPDLLLIVYHQILTISTLKTSQNPSFVRKLLHLSIYKRIDPKDPSTTLIVISMDVEKKQKNPFSKDLIISVTSVLHYFVTIGLISIDHHFVAIVLCTIQHTYIYRN